MAITHYMSQSNPILFRIQFNNPTIQTSTISYPIRLSSAHLTRNYFSYNIVKASPKTSISCMIMNHNFNAEKVINQNSNKVDINNERLLIWRSIENVLKALKKPVIIGVVVLLSLLLSCNYDDSRHALAASGGSMGGSDFSSSSSSDDDYYYNNDDSSSDDYFYSPVIQRETKKDTSSKSVASVEHCLRDQVVIAIVIISLPIFLLYLFSTKKDTSVLKLQVGLVGSARSVQRDLNVIAKTADTSKPNGFRFILQETIAALLRNPDYCISAYSSLEALNGVKQSEIRYKQLSAQENGKFDELTLVNFNNIRKQTAETNESNGSPNEYIVITVIVAAKGVHKLPPIKNIENLKEALKKLSSIPSTKIMAVEVLWTPQKENDVLTERQVREDYPLMHPF